MLRGTVPSGSVAAIVTCAACREFSACADCGAKCRDWPRHHPQLIGNALKFQYVISFILPEMVGRAVLWNIACRQRFTAKVGRLLPL
jgi:hypothetical protein